MLPPMISDRLCPDALAAAPPTPTLPRSSRGGGKVLELRN
jgi:hypothetical protein